MIILSDFSKTFTRSDMPTAWSTIVQSNLLPAKYVADRNALYEKYHSYELSGDVEMTERWFRDHLKLYVKHHLTDEMIEQIVLDDRFFAPRDGVKEFLDMVREKNVPLIIVSSGISDFIRIWFKKRFDYVPSEIISNGLKWDYGTAVAIDDEILITPLDKHIDLLRLLGESAGYWAGLRGLVEKSKIAGPMIHDARVAALCLEHGVTELGSADRDFSRFAPLKVKNPLAS